VIKKLMWRLNLQIVEFALDKTFPWLHGRNKFHR